MLHDIWLRARSLFRSRTVDRELDEELRFHLEQHVAAGLARGLTRADAVRTARLELGGVDQIKEDHRDARGVVWVTDLARDIRYAVRTFRRLPGFAAIALFTMALGIAATTVMFTVVYHVLFKPLPYRDARGLVTVHGRSDARGESWGISYPEFLDLVAGGRSLTFAAWAYRGGIVSAPGAATYVDGRQVSADLFTVLGAPLAVGRNFGGADDRLGAAPVSIISHSLWQRRYAGRADIVGQPLTFDGTSYTIVGVAAPEFELGGAADAFTPLGQSRDQRMQNREARFLHVMGRLGPGTSFADGDSEVGIIARRQAIAYPASNAGRMLIVQPLLNEVVGTIGSTLWLLLAAVAIVLLIACVNVASLLLARAVAREGELATRVALGSSRGRVIRQCLTESAVLGVAGGACGVLLAIGGIGPFVALWPGTLPRAHEIQIDWRLLLGGLAASLVSGLAFGLAPALRVPAAGVDAALRAGGRTVARGSHRLHGAFLVTQLAMTIVLLVSAGTLARTLIALSSLDPGLDTDGIVTARIALSPGVLGDPARINAAWSDVLDRIRHIPGVTSAALTDIVPMRPGENSLPYSPTAAALSSDAPLALASGVSPDYLAVMGTPLRAGRFFDEHDRLGSEAVVVVDEQLAQAAFGRTDVVGRPLWVPALGAAPVRIVGVLGHVRHWGLARDDRSRVRAQMYYPLAQVPPRLLRLFASLMSITIRTRPARAETMPALIASLQSAAGDHALYEIRTMEQLVSASLARQRFVVRLFAIFGGIALLLACVGVYGVLAYLTNQRAGEFSVRLALGSTPARVIGLVLRQSAVLIAAGVAIGLAVSWSSGRLLEQFVEGTQPIDLLTVVTMTGTLAAAALLSSAIPARRAARTDALQALRHNSSL